MMESVLRVVSAEYPFCEQARHVSYTDLKGIWLSIILSNNRRWKLVFVRFVEAFGLERS
jgi:hypothetical protein